MSRQKELVFRILQESEGHLTASEVFERARKAFPNISLGTVYRDLSELYDESRIGRFIPSDGKAVFDITPAGHFHIRCSRCGKISDLYDTAIMDRLVESVPGKIDTVNLSIDYVCNDCIGLM